jgi:hypothetical protein
LYFEGCPGHRVVRRRLRALLAEAGVTDRVRERRVNTDGDARRERFLGSPTLRVNGVDIDPNAAERTDYGLKCRLYSTADGLAGAPPDEWVMDALRRGSRIAGRS